MALRLKIPTASKGAQRPNGGLLSRDPLIRFALLGFLCASLVVIGVFSYWYVKYDRIIEERFRGPVFSSSAKIYASPRILKVGQGVSTGDIAADLRRAGYSETGESSMGTFRQRAGAIEISPGPESYHSQEPATITVSGARFRKSTAAPPGISPRTNWNRNS